MSQDSFQSLVNRLESAWSGRPEGLLRQTVAWVTLGYLALAFSVLAGFVLLVTGVVIAVLYQSLAVTLLAGLISLAGLALAVFVLGCLWVRFEPPEGLVLEERDHPELHRLLCELGDLAGGVRFHRVMLDAEMNASVVQNPRLGVFGWYRAHLVIGLPLMEALSLDELKAVLAHEIGHLTRADGKTCAWLHRTRETWERVVDRFSRNGFCPVIGDFFQWFWPRFNSRALVLSRFSELAADQFAAQAVSPQALASGLRRLAILGKRVEYEFWEPLDRAVDEGIDLPADVMDRLSEAVRRPVDPDQAAAWLAEAMAVRTGSTDSHPGLAPRLAALVLPAVPDDELPLDLPGDMSSADHLLTPPFLEHARRHFSRMWLEEVRECRARQARLQDLEHAAGIRKAWDRIAALVRLDGLEKVQPEVMALLERQPAHSGALYLRGSHLAEKCDPQACEFLERATSDPTIASRAFETLERLHTSHGREKEAALIKERALQHDLELRAALVERSRISNGDSFFPHDLCDTDLHALRELLNDEPSVARAWLAAKEVRHFPRWPLVVIGLELSYSLSANARRALDTQLMHLWSGEAYVMVFLADEGMKPVLRTLRRTIPDAEVYRRK
ncbi:M48 family metallopeptidase [Luteolibacter arcticus]|uniref:M48 family metallopeptidase n=1 Tax=Luteolibacter arcticus TaxID=1581411 RepID=A0ABT3GN31_9BACT|nr:M48 family metallopeptidase [Luteolibacter arcticus]MCW1924923.1 M48 family metallopeptidase [Luteolibacter arcticus]